MAERWKKIDADQTLPLYLSADDECFYARDYVSGGSYNDGLGNSLIQNFKKDISRKGSPEWRWKVAAIHQFARELGSALEEGVSIAAIPSSKCKTDPEFDPRMDELLATMLSLKPSLKIEEPIFCRETMQAAHLGGSRNPDAIFSNLEWRGLKVPTKLLVLVDDVITTGAHFVACKRLAQQNCPDLKVVAAFWAKTIWPD